MLHLFRSVHDTVDVRMPHVCTRKLLARVHLCEPAYTLHDMFGAVYGPTGPCSRASVPCSYVSVHRLLCCLERSVMDLSVYDAHFPSGRSRCMYSRIGNGRLHTSVFHTTEGVKRIQYLKKQNVHRMIWFKLVLYTIFMWTSVAFCDVSHDQVWTCMLGTNCMNKYQLHSTIRRKAKSLRRHFLMAVEGPKYHRLFEDCDSDKNGCLDMLDIVSAGDSCKRSCIWRQTMQEFLC
jgi:hypothetical protein